MKIILVSCALLLLVGCSHTGGPNPQSSSQEEAKGALDDAGFLPRLFGQEEISPEPDLVMPEEEGGPGDESGEDGPDSSDENAEDR